MKKYCTLLLITLTLLSTSCQTPEPAENRAKLRAEATAALKTRQFPASLTQHDVMTDLDVLYIRDMKIGTSGKSVDDWPLIKQLRRLSIDISDSAILADHLNTSLPIEGQKEFDWLQEMVDECCAILDVQSPLVMVQQNSTANAYVTRMEEPHVLVVTSGLLNAYEQNPDELRFVIGHEIGHLKCGHIRAHAVGRTFIQILLSGKGGFVKEKVITPILVWKLLEWQRASEMSADRAGMLCIGYESNDPGLSLQTSQQALLRLLHGTDQQVDPERYMHSVIKIERDAPFVRIARQLQALNANHPFISERCIALKSWSRSQQYRELVNRSEPLPKNTTLVIESVRITGLPKTDYGSANAQKCDPIISVSYGDRERKTRHFENLSNVDAKHLNWNFRYAENGRLVVTVTDYNELLLNKPLGELLLPVNADLTETSGKLQAATSAQSTATVVVTYSIR